MRSPTKKVKLWSRDGEIHECEVKAGTPLVIGRGEVDLFLDCKRVSRRHCQLELDQTGKLEVVDLGSYNGTCLNGKRVERSLIKDGDDLVLGPLHFRVELVEPVPFALTNIAAPPSERTLRARLEGMGFHVLESVDFGSNIPTFRAHRTDLDQDVVVKAMAIGDDPLAQDRAARLLREAKLAAKVRHPNIVQIYDVRQAPGMLAIVLESVEGRTLSQEIAKKGRLPTSAALMVGVEVCRALEHAHSLHVIHRNITPATIMLGTNGTVKLVDFGLAKQLAPIDQENPLLTREGQPLGSVEYAAPEQARDAAAVDVRADIYAVGSTMYHALSGEPPFVSWIPTALDAAQPNVPAPLSKIAPEIPQPVRAVVERAMKPVREERYQDASELLRALEGALALLDPVSAVSRRIETSKVVSRPGGAGSSTQAVSGFFGAIQGDELVELLQMVEINRKSGSLEIYGHRPRSDVIASGTIAFRDGKIIEARSDEHDGLDAAFELLMITAGNFRVSYGEAPQVRQEQPISISGILMEVCRRRDEAQSKSDAAGIGTAGEMTLPPA